MKWKHPPITKIYEAIGTVADNRVEVSGDSAKIYSSSRKKYYEVTYDPENQAIMSNDNASYWQGYLGYPGIAFLMKVGVLSYDKKLAESLKDVSWKDLNTKFKNNYNKTIEYILSSQPEKKRQELTEFVEKIDGEIKALGLSLLGKKKFPPNEY